METENLDQQLSFLKEIDKVKYIERKTCLFNSKRHENDAEHSWHLAMMALVLNEYANKDIDLLKVIKMLLIHDIVEIDAGDTFLFDTSKSHSNTEEELKAAHRIFGLLPDDQASHLIKIWEEFEEAETEEAKFAKALDHFEPILQNVSNQGGTWAEFNVPYNTVHKKKCVIKEGSKVIWSYAEDLLDQSVKNGILED